ncbi:MAG: polysaccharide deacetylase family protein [Anaerolineae bacterium]|nr:polysaccharide deacetylase family protein [Anaerolineae bacterium]
MRNTCLLAVVALLIVGIVSAPEKAYADSWDFKPRRTHVPILMYHYVDRLPANADDLLKDLVVTPEAFEAQVTWLQTNGYQSITPDDLIAALWRGNPLPPKPVMFTFDDGYANAWYNVYPILAKHGFTGTVFVVTDWIDANRPGYLTWDLARLMVQGGMYIQSHSRSHEDFRHRSHDWYVKQIEGSIQAIEMHTGVRPRFFCYPFGGYDNIAIKELQAAGIVGAFTENDSRFQYASNTMRLPRVRIRGAWTLQQFIGMVTDNR